MNLTISLKPEILKTKRTASYYLTFIAAAFTPFMSMLDLFIGEGASADQKKTLFNQLFVDGFQMTSVVALPMFIILICTLLPQIEYKSNAWKQILASPQTKVNIFLAKFINVQLLIMALLLINLLITFVCAVFLHFKEPSIHLLNQPLNWHDILMTRVNCYIALLALCCIQFWLGLKFKNFIIPIASGISFWFAGTLLVMPIKSSFAPYFPYSFHVFVSFKDFKPKVNSILWTSVGYAALALLIGFLDFRKKQLNK